MLFTSPERFQIHFSVKRHFALDGGSWLNVFVMFMCNAVNNARAVCCVGKLFKSGEVGRGGDEWGGRRGDEGGGRGEGRKESGELPLRPSEIEISGLQRPGRESSLFSNRRMTLVGGCWISIIKLYDRKKGVNNCIMEDLFISGGVVM